VTRGTITSLVVAALGVLGISAVQPALAKRIHKIHERDDVFILPPPAEMRVLTLGYRSTVADLLWADLLYENGIHWQEHRTFKEVGRFIDAILAIEPDFQSIYLFAATLILYTPGGVGEAEARAVRVVLERGIAERAHDPDVWLAYGQYLAFMAPSYLKDETEIQAWRKDGALALAHAVGLGADADRSLAASTILNKAGEHQAALQNLEQAYSVTDDPETKRQILFKLQQMKVSFANEEAVDNVEREWRTRWPFLPKGEALLIGPPRSTARCAGPTSYTREGCARDWQGFIDGRR
jgi:hypothetical protein